MVDRPANLTDDRVITTRIFPRREYSSHARENVRDRDLIRERAFVRVPRQGRDGGLEPRDIWKWRLRDFLRQRGANGRSPMVA